MTEVLLCDLLYTQSNMSLYGSQKVISCCRNNGILTSQSAALRSISSVERRHLDFIERSVFTLVFDTFQEFEFETYITISTIKNE